MFITIYPNSFHTESPCDDNDDHHNLSHDIFIWFALQHSFKLPSKLFLLTPSLFKLSLTLSWFTVTRNWINLQLSNVNVTDVWNHVEFNELINTWIKIGCKKIISAEWLVNDSGMKSAPVDRETLHSCRRLTWYLEKLARSEMTCEKCRVKTRWKQIKNLFIHRHTIPRS